LKLHGYGKFSTSEMAKGIKKGDYDGWDDVRLPTLRALRRRGFTPEAIYDSMLSLGLSETDIAFSMENLHSANRTLIDERSMRFFFVAEPVEVRLEGDVPGKANPPLFPQKPGSETRSIPVGKSVALAADDVKKLKNGQVVRLKDLCNVTVDSVKSLLLRFESEEVRKGLPILHWCPLEPEGMRCRVAGPEGSWEGVCERGVMDYFNVFATDDKKDEPFMVQFERFGYCRVLCASEGGVECAWTHK
jgi:glutamyl-tRNA synthetase